MTASNRDAPAGTTTSKDWVAPSAMVLRSETADPSGPPCGSMVTGL